MRFLACAGLLFSISLAAQSEGWHYRKDDPQSKKHIIQIDAASMEATADARTFRLQDMTARVYDLSGGYRVISSKDAVVNEKSGALSYGPGLKSVMNF